MRLRDENDVRFMTEALRLARRLPRRTWPNPPVGAVVVRDGEIIARGAHLGPGLDHAEAVALAEAGERARGATIYVTLEPCNHQGRTPACAPRIVAAGVKRVVFGIRDPNPRVAGGGLAHLRDAGVEVAFGIAAAECLELVWPFVATDAFARPFVLLKTAASLDGRFAPPPESDTAGRPFYLTGAESLAAVGRMRRWSDIVLVGSGTVTADAPRLDGRRVGPDAGCPAADPVAACADTRLAHAVDWAAPGRLVFCGPDSDPGRARAMAEAGAEIVDCDARDGRVDPAGLLARCAERGLDTVMIEGGPTLAASFLAAGLVDRWAHFTAPRLLGGGPAWPEFPADLRAPGGVFTLTRAEASGGDLLAVWDRRPFAATLSALTAEPDAAAHAGED